MSDRSRITSKFRYNIVRFIFPVAIVAALPLYVLAGGGGSSSSGGGDNGNSPDSSGFTSNEEAAGAIGSSYTNADGSVTTSSYNSAEGAYYSRTFTDATLSNQISYSCSNGRDGTSDGNGGWNTTSNTDGSYGSNGSGTGSTNGGDGGSGCGYVYGAIAHAGSGFSKTVSGWQYTCNMTDACPSGFGLTNGICTPLAVCSGQDTTNAGGIGLAGAGTRGSTLCTCPVGYQAVDNYVKQCTTKYTCRGSGGNGGSDCLGWTCGAITIDQPRCSFVGCPSGYTQMSEGVNAPVAGVNFGGAASSGSGISVCVSGATSQTTCTARYLCGTGGNLYRESANCAISTSPVQICQYGCTGATCSLPPAPKVVSFSLAPSLITSGKTTKISWDVKNVTNCTVTGSNNPPDTWTQPAGSESWTSSGASSAITGQTIYTLHCSIISGAVNADGSPATWTDQTATVDIVPKFHEQ